MSNTEMSNTEMSNTEMWIRFFGDMDKEPDNEEYYNIILVNGWNKDNNFMILALRTSYKYKSLFPRLLEFMLDNGFPLYNVEVVREIISYHTNCLEFIDIYLNRGLDFNDGRLYEPIEVEDYNLYYDSQEYDTEDEESNNDTEDNEPTIRLLYQPILYFARSIPMIKKIMENGGNKDLDLKRNIYCKEWSAFKKAIDYGDMETVNFYMEYINDEYLKNEEWWGVMLNHVSQDGNVGKGAEKCYEILIKREKLLNTNKLPNRKIYDLVKNQWCYKVKEDPGEFSD